MELERPPKTPGKQRARDFMGKHLEEEGARPASPAINLKSLPRGHELNSTDEEETAGTITRWKEGVEEYLGGVSISV